MFKVDALRVLFKVNATIDLSGSKKLFKLIQIKALFLQRNKTLFFSNH